MKGCHNCTHDLSLFASFEEAPCAKCTTAEAPVLSGQDAPMDVQFCEQLTCMHPAYVEKTSERDAMFQALSNCIFSLLRMKDKFPETFDFAMTKIQNPSLSYEKIAAMYNCKKQNVQYHLKRAMSICKELEAAILVDQRYN